MSEGTKLVVGLGNPGWRYRRTRHNVGFLVVDALVRTAGGRFVKRPTLGARVAPLVLGDSEGGQGEGIRAIVLKPQTYMNRSGLAVRAAMVAWDIAIGDLLIVVDDVNLPLGRLRVRRGGSDGGHNGLRSIAESLGSTEFARIRVGVGGSRHEDLTDHVLGKFDRLERPLVRRVVATACDALTTSVCRGVEPAMSTFNGMDLAAPTPRGLMEE